MADHAQQHEDESRRAGQECMEAALHYLSLGWSVLGLCPPDHVGVGREHGKSCASPGKRPWPDGGAWKRWQDERPDEATVRRWWHDHPMLNVGVALGPVSGLVRVDVDGEAGEVALLELSGGDLPVTLEFLSGREGGGRGLLYAIPEGAQLRTTVRHTEGDEVRLQAKGSQTVLPPSRHVSGGRYRWVSGRGPGEIDAAPCPAWLLAALSADGPRTDSDGKPRLESLADGEIIPAGRCDEILTSMAGTMRRRGFSSGAIEDALLREIEDGRVETQAGKRPYDATDAKRIATSVGRYKPDAFAGVTIKIHEPSRNGRVPHPSAADLTEEEGKQDATSLDLIRISATIRWAWKGWLQYGVINIIASEPGVGKTRLCADLARRVYNGLPWPDGSPPTFPPGSTTLWVASDNQHPELGTLPTEFGFDPGALYLNTTRADPFGGTILDEPEDLKEFESRIVRLKPALVFIDTTLHATERSAHKPEDARAFFAPLQQIAARQGAVLAGITHLNAAGKPLGRRVSGAARVVAQLEYPDPDNQPFRRKLYVVKSNSLFPAPLGVTMGSQGNEYDLNPPSAPDKPTFGGPSPRLQEAIQWLRQELSQGTRRVSDLRSLADQKGIPTSLLYRARDAIGITELKTEGYKWWALANEEEDRGEL